MYEPLQFNACRKEPELSWRAYEEQKLSKQEEEFWDLLMRDVQFVLSVLQVKKKSREIHANSCKLE